ncbi:mitochondrial glutamate carrier 1-like [Ctenocephalides felis]|uniref:mitochondrial glutamate carrier 1-like n=1 Tax=Ctenocephalides felis TaxID=7515 RepID=UPI000E6E2C54|nr:mitochondrial glutamate carrier 1-like [Ctenocephalides felis]
MSDYDENEAEKMSHELVHEILVAFVRSLKYIFLPLPKENYFEKWSKEGFPFGEKLLGSSMAALIGMSGTVPMDLIRHLFIIYKTWPESVRKYTYTSGFNCLYHTAESKNFLGMYKPAVIDITLRSPKLAFKMVLNEYYGFALTSPRGEFPPFNRFMAAVFTGLTTGFLSSPFEVFRYRYWQTRYFRSWYLPPMTNLEIWEQLFSPMGRNRYAMILRAVAMENLVNAFIYFPLQHYLRKYLTSNHIEGPWTSFVTGWMAATVALVTVTPIDNIKKQIVRIPDYTDLYTCPNDKPDYDSLRDCLRRYIRYRGFPALFEGVWCRVGVKSRVYGVVQLFYDLRLTEGMFSKEPVLKTLEDFEQQLFEMQL